VKHEEIIELQAAEIEKLKESLQRICNIENRGSFAKNFIEAQNIASKALNNRKIHVTNGHRFKMIRNLRD